MNRKLTAKVQKLTAPLPETANSFTNIILVEPDVESIIQRKGTLYAFFGIAGSNEFDTKLITKVVIDVISDSYYHSENISPIQSLEKAIIDVRDKVTKLHNESIRVSESNVEFNMLAAVLWGNVIYIVQYGDSKGYLVREGTIKPINVNTEGKFASSSGIVKPDDVIIFNSPTFNELFPPDKLLTSSIVPEDLPINASCLMLKFLVDSEFSEAEVIDFGVDIETKPNKLANMISAITTKLPKLPKFRFQLPTISLEAFTPKQTTTIRLKSEGHKSKFKFGPSLLISITAVLLALSIFYTTLNKDRNTDNTLFTKLNELTNEKLHFLKKPKESTTTIELTKIEPSEEELQAKIDEQNKNDAIYKIQRVELTPFYDIKIADPKANPTEIAIVDNSLVVVDKILGKTYISDVKTPKFTTREFAYEGINSLQNVDGMLGFADKEGYKVVDLTNNKLIEKYAQLNLTRLVDYNDNLYSIEGDELKKYTRATNALKATTWSTNTDFTNARSLAISINIYVLKENGTLVKYSKGEKTEFKVTGLDKPFTAPVQIVTNNDLKNIYIADTGNNRIVVLDKEGVLIKQIATKNNTDLNNIRGISITKDDKSMFVLSESVVYEITL